MPQLTAGLEYGQALEFRPVFLARLLWLRNAWKDTGLNYTSFAYSNLKVDVSSSQSIRVEATLTNTWRVDGAESVLLFLRQETRTANVPEAKRLVQFSKIEVGAGKSAQVSFDLKAKDWGVYTNKIGDGLVKQIPAGKYTLMLTATADCSKPGLCVSFESDKAGSYKPTQVESATLDANSGVAWKRYSTIE